MQCKYSLFNVTVAYKHTVRTQIHSVILCASIHKQALLSSIGVASSCMNRIAAYVNQNLPLVSVGFKGNFIAYDLNHTYW